MDCFLLDILIHDQCFLDRIHCRNCDKRCYGEALRVQDFHFHPACFVCKGRPRPTGHVKPCVISGLQPALKHLVMELICQLSRCFHRYVLGHICTSSRSYHSYVHNPFYALNLSLHRSTVLWKLCIVALQCTQ